MLTHLSITLDEHSKHQSQIPLYGTCLKWHAHVQDHTTKMWFLDIYTFQRDTQCSTTNCLLMLRCQLYMFRTITVHPQELLFRCCMCKLWYVARNALPGTSSWYNVWGSSSSNVAPAGRINTYHSLHIHHLKRSSWGWTVTVRNM